MCYLCSDNMCMNLLNLMNINLPYLTLLQNLNMKLHQPSVMAACPTNYRQGFESTKGSSQEREHILVTIFTFVDKIWVHVNVFLSFHFINSSCTRYKATLSNQRSLQNGYIDMKRWYYNIPTTQLTSNVKIFSQG